MKLFKIINNSFSVRDWESKGISWEKITLKKEITISITCKVFKIFFLFFTGLFLVPWPHLHNIFLSSMQRISQNFGESYWNKFALIPFSLNDLKKLNKKGRKKKTRGNLPEWLWMQKLFFPPFLLFFKIVWEKILHI